MREKGWEERARKHSRKTLVLFTGLPIKALLCSPVLFLQNPKGYQDGWFSNWQVLCILQASSGNKRAVLANVPSFRFFCTVFFVPHSGFWYRRSFFLYPRSGFPEQGNICQNHPFGNRPLQIPRKLGIVVPVCFGTRLGSSKFFTDILVCFWQFT